MDKFFARNKELEKAEFSIGLFPGSRFPEALDNFVLILEVLEVLSDLRYFQKIKFNFAIVNALSSLRIKEIFQKRGWLKLEHIKDNNLLKFQYKFLEVNMYWNNFDKILLKSNCCISMAGTAAEQAIGLGNQLFKLKVKVHNLQKLLQKRKDVCLENMFFVPVIIKIRMIKSIRQ